MSKSRTTPLRAAVRAGAIAAAALGATAASASAAVPSFYVPPTSLPATNGAIVRSQPQPLGASIVIGGVQVWLPAKATKNMYKSTDANGQSVAVTGVYLEPTKAWTGSGPRPLVSYAEGTQGQGDACAPSRTLQNTITVDSGQFSIGYEVPGIYGFLDKGIAVVVTDYIGLGTPDRIHTYVDRLDMGHAVLDAARAALNVSGASVTSASPVGIYGYSQGGRRGRFGRRAPGQLRAERQPQGRLRWRSAREPDGHAQAGRRHAPYRRARLRDQRPGGEQPVAEADPRRQHERRRQGRAREGRRPVHRGLHRQLRVREDHLVDVDG